MTVEWREAVRRALNELGRDQKWLAQEVGASEPSLTNTLKGKSKTSVLVEPVSELLGVPLPEFRSLVEQRMIVKIREIQDRDAATYHRVHDMIERMHGSLLDGENEKNEKKRNK